MKCGRCKSGQHCELQPNGTILITCTRAETCNCKCKNKEIHKNISGRRPEPERKPIQDETLDLIEKVNAQAEAARRKEAKRLIIYNPSPIYTKADLMPKYPKEFVCMTCMKGNTKKIFQNLKAWNEAKKPKDKQQNCKDARHAVYSKTEYVTMYERQQQPTKAEIKKIKKIERGKPMTSKGRDARNYTIGVKISINEFDAIQHGIEKHKF